MSKECVTVPETFQNPLFFKDGDFFYDSELDIDQFAAIPLLIDLLCYKGKLEQTCLNYEHLIGILLKQWKKEKVEIAEDFRRRDRTAARPKMIKGIGWFLSLLHWMDDRCVENLSEIVQSISEVTNQPVNLKERFSYVLEAPDHFQSFIQLSELFDETEKKWHSIIRKNQHMDKN